MSWITTYTGKKFYPCNPKIEDIDIYDIAHALSNMCRYGGHCKQFYSVAQHSVLVSRICPYPRKGLLHDGSEAYICDLPRPFKQELIVQGFCYYRDLESKIEALIEQKFDLEPECIKYWDTVALYSEKQTGIINGDDWQEWNGEVLNIEIPLMYPPEAKQLFLNRAKEIGII